MRAFRPKTTVAPLNDVSIFHVHNRTNPRHLVIPPEVNGVFGLMSWGSTYLLRRCLDVYIRNNLLCNAWLLALVAFSKRSAKNLPSFAEKS